MNNTAYNFMRTFLGLTLISLVVGCCKTDNPQLIEEIMPYSEHISLNILLVIADDIGVDATPGYNLGNIQIHMPNLLELQVIVLTSEGRKLAHTELAKHRLIEFFLV